MPPIVAAPRAVEARNAVTIAHGRLQLLRRLADRGEVDYAPLLTEPGDVCLHIPWAVAMVDAVEDEAGALARSTALAPNSSRNLRPS